MRVEAVTGEPDLAQATLIAGVLDGLEPLPGSESAFESVDPALLEVSGFEGKDGQSVFVPHERAGHPASRGTRGGGFICQSPIRFWRGSSQE